MSELKAGVIATPHDEGMIFHRDSDVIAVTERETEFYLKSEADKVIKGLKEGAKNLILDNYLKDREIKHHKYKRCLAMARWCGDACDKWMMRKAKAIVLGKDGVEEYHRARRKLSHYMRWQNRWMKLAEKFKEAK